LKHTIFWTHRSTEVVCYASVEARLETSA